MLKPRVSFNRLLATATIFALPGLAVVAVLLFLHILSPLIAIAAVLGCIFVATMIAVPVARDIAQVLRYGDDLARGATRENPELSGWEPASEMAAIMRRILRETEDRTRLGTDALPGKQMFDALPQPLILIDGGRRVNALNQSARDLFGTDPTGVDLSAAIRAPRVLEAADRVLAEGTRRAVGFTVPLPVERFFWAEIVPFAEKSPKGAEVLIVLYDLTERQRAEQMRADFVANASHELRTPLSTLIGFIETLKGPARDDAEARDNFLDLMAEQANRMARLVRDLLALSTIELSEHAAPDDPVDLDAVVKRVAGALEIEAAKKGVTIAVDTRTPSAIVSGDAEQMTQVFQNLIDNAIKYGRAGGTVRAVIEDVAEIPPDLPRAALDAARAQGLVRVSVHDQGAGIAPEHIPRLTERFYRVDAARSREVGGTGLGLAIVKHIVNRHRGLLQIASEEGVGSVFSVTLARAADL